jgi:hypothetical protein
MKINLVEMLVSLGYKEATAKGTKTRFLKKIKGFEEIAKETFMVEPKVAKEILNNIGTGKTDKAVGANKMLASKGFEKFTNEYVPTKTVRATSGTKELEKRVAELEKKLEALEVMLNML